MPELMRIRLLSFSGTREKLSCARCPLLSKNYRNIFLISFSPNFSILNIFSFYKKILICEGQPKKRPYDLFPCGIPPKLPKKRKPAPAAGTVSYTHLDVYKRQLVIVPVYGSSERDLI